MNGIYSTEQRQELVRDVHVDDEIADAAWATVQKYCKPDADEIGRMLGLVER